MLVDVPAVPSIELDEVGLESIELLSKQGAFQADDIGLRYPST